MSIILTSPAGRLAAGIAAAASIAACGTSPTSPAPASAVQVRVAADGATATAPQGLSVSTVRLVVGHASLGSGDQFGCVNCTGNNTDAEAAPSVVTLAGGAGSAVVAVGDVQPGTYSAAEIDLTRPTTALVGSSPGQTIEITGVVNGAPFTISAAVEGAFRGTLSPPVQVAGGSSAPVTVTVALPVTAWFTSGAGLLDPAVPVQRTQILANIQAAFSAAGEGAESPAREGSEG